MNSSFCIDIPTRLITRIQRGELGAFEQVYRLFERPAWTLALRMIGNPEDAREVVHDAMLRVFDRARQFRGDSPFWGWVRRIVVNEALMRLRRDRTHVEQAYDETEQAHEADTSTPAPWAWTEARQLESALEALPALTRSVIWLYHVEGHTHPEIAEMTGKSVSFSKSQLARGTARLRELLGTCTPESPCSPTLMATP
ncbi:RNA polymerase sigma factor [Dokdonella immobilis]|uniref:RNA polymerase sigma factor n=1 Tax=Dokdonella immobilis TaxID=578942 RepID=UPI001FE5F856|nr:sigma-70 family RNA polymerase sigma factor [Dokdonella immobilis]